MVDSVLFPGRKCRRQSQCYYWVTPPINQPFFVLGANDARVRLRLWNAGNLSSIIYFKFPPVGGVFGINPNEGFLSWGGQSGLGAEIILDYANFGNMMQKDLYFTTTGNSNTLNIVETIEAEYEP